MEGFVEGRCPRGDPSRVEVNRITSSSAPRKTVWLGSRPVRTDTDDVGMTFCARTRGR